MAAARERWLRLVLTGRAAAKPRRPEARPDDAAHDLTAGQHALVRGDPRVLPSATCDRRSRSGREPAPLLPARSVRSAVERPCFGDPLDQLRMARCARSAAGTSSTKLADIAPVMPMASCSQPDPM